MAVKNTSNSSSQGTGYEEEIDLKQLFDSYSRYWKVFLIGIFLAVLAALIYLRYTPKVYEVKAKILLQEKDKSQGELVGLFEDAGLDGLSGSAFVADQMDVMRSRRIFRQVIQSNSLNINYFVKGRLKDAELPVDDSPLRLILMEEGSNTALDSLFYNFDVKIGTGNSLDLTDEEGEKKKIELGSAFSSPIGKLMLVPQTSFKKYRGRELSISYQPVEKLIGTLERNIELQPNKDKQSYVVNFSLKSTVPKKAERILDTLIKKYDDDITRDRRRVVEATTEFISSRLELVGQDLKEADLNVAEFKENQDVTDIEEESKLFLESASETNRELLQVQTQLQLAEMLREKVRKEDFDLLPSNLGLDDESIEQSIRKHNELVLERNELLETATDSNPVVENLNRSIQGLTRALNSSLDNYKSSLSVKAASLERELGGYRGRLANTPGYEQDFKPIMRRQQIVETLYMFLLQKREESDIRGAAPPQILKVINSAYTADNPVAPKSKIILLAAVILGFLIPFGLIYLKFLLDNKVHSRQDVEAYLKAPIIGEIPKSGEMVGDEKDHSEVAEAFRILRNNINFVLKSQRDPVSSPVIYITSTVAREGKSFVANNLSKILAMLGKKVLLVGADIRNPKVLQYLNIEQEYGHHAGVTHYLSNPREYTLEDIVIKKPKTYNFDVIHAGPIPPTPAELLLNGRFSDIIQYGKKHYDFVLVDTAPLALVSDTLSIMENADLTIYTVRADFLETEMLNLPKDLYENDRIKNMTVVLNDVDFSKGSGYGYYGYGYRYGYGTGDNLSFLDRLRNLFNAFDKK